MHRPFQKIHDDVESYSKYVSEADDRIRSDLGQRLESENICTETEKEQLKEGDLVRIKTPPIAGANKRFQSRLSEEIYRVREVHSDWKTAKLMLENFGIKEGTRQKKYHQRIRKAQSQVRE